MPSLRRETGVAAVSWSADRRPADAMPDFGDYGFPGWEPEPGRRQARKSHHRADPVRPRTRRNGLPEQRFYVTDQIREYYAAQGRILPAARAYYGTGRDTLTGHLTGRQIKKEAGNA
jgi:hypothetical protein